MSNLFFKLSIVHAFTSLGKHEHKYICSTLSIINFAESIMQQI